MNVERLLRQVEKRLGAAPESLRKEVLDAVREEIARERRFVERELTVEAERARRLEAETLRDILEAINRQASLEDTIEEVLKQLARIVSFDSCSLALAQGDGSFRIIAARGFPPDSAIVGSVFHDSVSDRVRDARWPVAIHDVQGEPGFARIAGTEAIRSWAGLPLLMEGDVVGLLCLDRNRTEPFDDEDLHRAKAVAFSAAAAIRKAQLLEQLRRYATLMERVVAIDQAVFAGQPPSEVARAILEGALLLGNYRGGLLVLADGAPRVEAAAGDAFAGTGARRVPAALDALATVRLPDTEAATACRALGAPAPRFGMFLVPVATPSRQLGTLVLLDPNGETPDDRLLEAYASRAATAYLHSLRQQGGASPSRSSP